MGNASISGVIVDADDKTGLANNISQIIIGGNLNQKNLNGWTFALGWYQA